MSLCIVLIFYAIVVPPQEFRLENYFTGDFAFYSSERIQSPLVTHTTDLGFSFIYHTASQNATALRRNFTRIDGESVTMHRHKETRTILQRLDARKVSTSTIGEIDIVYAYTSRIPTFITKGGRRINIQIAHRSNRTTIGWPVILGSF